MITIFQHIKLMEMFLRNPRLGELFFVYKSKKENDKENRYATAEEKMRANVLWIRTFIEIL